ncbi:hypothetical protein [Actinoplanes sp. NPDC051494]|uniref:hypothetical protein n=1 Tax=Actinoplanes sp. NPDC051494 TaxID=3363907 RepID=UPI0037882FA5
MTRPLPSRPTQAGHRRRVDLGRLNPDCTADFHGTYTAYRRGCRCPHAREDHRLYQKRLRQGRNQPRVVDVTGAARRIQALWAIGHTSDDIVAAASGVLNASYVANLWRRQMVTVFTWQAVARVYRELSAVPGRSERTRRRAAAAGYPSPMRWGADIDDPAAVPDPVAAEVEPGDLDMVVVEAVLAGDSAGRDLSPAEQVEVLHRGMARGRSLTSLAELLHVNNYIARTLLAGRMPTQMAKRQAVETELLRTGGGESNFLVARRLGVNRQTVARARARLTDRLQLAS